MSTSPPDLVWSPDPKKAEASAIAAFARFVRGRGAPIGGTDYAALHAWSVRDLAGFWSAAARKNHTSRVEITCPRIDTNQCPTDCQPIYDNCTALAARNAAQEDVTRAWRTCAHSPFVRWQRHGTPENP
jgi:hypothetical protein